MSERNMRINSLHISQQKLYWQLLIRFKDVSILSSTHSTITEDPTPTSSEWTLVMSGISRESDTSFTELTYIFNISNELQTRHIALYSSNGDGLNIQEVQIIVYGKGSGIMFYFSL